MASRKSERKLARKALVSDPQAIRHHNDLLYEHDVGFVLAYTGSRDEVILRLQNNLKRREDGVRFHNYLVIGPWRARAVEVKRGSNRRHACVQTCTENTDRTSSLTSTFRTPGWAPTSRRSSGPPNRPRNPL